MTGTAAGRLRLSPAEHRSLSRKARRRRELTGWVFLGPFLACFLVFLVLPVAGTIWWSTRAGSIFGGTKFIGFRNFVELPGVVGAWSSIENTLLFAVYSVPAILVGALAIALVLARVRRGASIYRFLVYFPVLVPGVVAALIWLFLTNVDFGLFNEVIRLFGGKPVIWLGADNALNLDGGGSTAMYFGGGYISGPGRLLPNAVVLTKP